MTLTPLQKYIFKRIIYSGITVFVVVFVVFVLSRSVGDPVAAYVTIETPPDVIEIIRKRYHLDESILIQFVYWLNGIIQGDWGRAFSHDREPVIELIGRLFPFTLELNLFVFAISLPLSFWVGTKAATNKDTWIDHSARVLAIIGQCVPQFFIGLLFLAFLYPRNVIAIEPRWTFQFITGMPTIDALINRDLGGFVEALKYLIGPLLTSLLASISLQMRILRSSILEELSKEYITTGKSKGLSKDYIEKKYARRNALIPFVTLVGYMVANLISGTAIIEVVFNRFGLGMIFAEAAKKRDHNTIQVFTLIFSIVLVSVNLIVDIIYGYIDPRIKHGEKK
jgi:peptide/nickel transport system permease protein